MSRVNKGQTSGPAMNSGSHRQTMWMSHSLYSIAKKLPPNPKVERKVKTPNKIPVPHLTDEQAKEVVRSFLAGVPQSALVDRTGFSDSCIRSLCNGVNRGHILREVEEEMRKAKRMMG